MDEQLDHECVMLFDLLVGAESLIYWLVIYWLVIDWLVIDWLVIYWLVQKQAHATEAESTEAMRQPNRDWLVQKKTGSLY
jgi:hypothetical protein